MNTIFSFLSSRIRPLVPAVSAAIVLVSSSGCAFLKPVKSESHYYVLTAAGPGGASRAKREEPGCAVWLQPVEVANYLENNGMAVCTGTNEVRYALFHLWAEPLDAGVRRALAEDFRRAPGIRAVVTDQPAPAHMVLYTVWVRVLKCEGSETGDRGSAVFEAAWEVRRAGTREMTVARGVFQSQPEDWRPGDYGQLAQRLSQELGDFSEVLTQAMSRRTASHASR